MATCGAATLRRYRRSLVFQFHPRLLSEILPVDGNCVQFESIRNRACPSRECPRPSVASETNTDAVSAIIV